MSGLTDLIMQIDDMEWLDRCTCVGDLDAYFVEPGHSIDPDVLNACRACPVRAEHVRHAYTCPNVGYNAGLSPSQRRAMTVDEALEFIKHDPPRPAAKPRRTRR